MDGLAGRTMIFFAHLELMPSGAFFSRPEAFGSTREEILAIEQNTIEQDRHAVVVQAMQESCKALVHAEAAGTC